jgi:CheY-like chemotaxis protein
MVALPRSFGSSESCVWWNDGLSPRPPILVAEFNEDNVSHLVECFARLQQPVRMALSPTDIMNLLRREVFSRAIVAAEMMIDGEPVVARLARLPMMGHVVATGPGDDTAMEVRARAAGASIYLPRPVCLDDLARAMAVPMLVRTRV